MTNREKLHEVFPRTIFIYEKQDDKTRAIMCSDEWLDAEYTEVKPPIKWGIKPGLESEDL